MTNGQSRLRVLFLTLAAASNVGIATVAEDGSAYDDRPNVLFIAVDDLRVELGCYGDTLAKSPNIDRLAARGTLFTRAYCQQSVCNPSRASALTGLRPDTLGVWDLRTHFREQRPDVITLPQLFKQHGYHTQDIGKIFHNYRQDEFKGDPASWSVPARLHYGSHYVDDHVQVDGDPPENLATLDKTECRDVPDEAYLDGRVAAEAVQALRQIKDRPFFLAVGFWKPHLPFNAPKKYWDLYDRSQVELPPNPDPPASVPPIALQDYRIDSKRELTDDDVRELRHGHYAAISYLDTQVGKVLDELDRLGLRERTIVMFWSDHGLHLGEHGLWSKTTCFELDARMPMIIATPDHKGRQRTDALVELLDLYPTLADLCRLRAPADIEGVSLRPVLEDPTASVKAAAFSQHPRPPYGRGKDPKVMGYSIRVDRYRYTEWLDFKTGQIVARELYDHADDPRETVNLAGREKLADREEIAAIIRRLATQMDSSLNRVTP
jgi:iduronate 2-sulfatase